jgi:hypothetical protein
MAQPATHQQLVLDIGVEIQRDVNGIEMGVLENGLPFLTQRGLAKITGTARSVIFDITQDWEQRYSEPVLGKDRNSFLREYLARNGYDEPKLYIETKKDGSIHYAYPDVVCMAILEYYAFEAKTPNPLALESFRRLATYGLQRFIYESLGYVPPDKWRYHHDRVSILQNVAPDGYFIIFHEVTGLIVDLINADLIVDHRTIPDISVGQCWGAHWNDSQFDGLYGRRVKFQHNYPLYYPQAASNPQLPWAYANEALPEFRRWFRQEYLPTRFPKYILSKAHLLGGQHEAQKIANLYQPKRLTGTAA